MIVGPWYEHLRTNLLHVLPRGQEPLTLHADNDEQVEKSPQRCHDLWYTRERSTSVHWHF